MNPKQKRAADLLIFLHAATTRAAAALTVQALIRRGLIAAEHPEAAALAVSFGEETVQAIHAEILEMLA